MAGIKKGDPAWNWLTLTALTWNMFMLDGIIRSYGLLYLELLDLYDKGPQETGLVATIFATMSLILAPISGWAADRFSPKFLMIIGALTATSGAILASFASSLVFIYIGYSFFMGSAHSMVFIATTAAVSKLFTYNRPLASGILFAGGSLGSMLWPLLFRYLADEYSVRGVFLIYAGLMLNYMVSGIMIRQDKKYVFVDSVELTENVNVDDSEANHNIRNGNDAMVKKSSDNSHKLKSTWRSLVSALVNIKFLGLMLYQFGFIFGQYGFLMYVPPYAKEMEMTDMQISLLLSVCGGTDLIGRLTVGFLANLSYVNIYLLLLINLSAVGVLAIFLPTLVTVVPPLTMLLVTIAVLGLFVGGLTSLLNQLVVNAVGIDFAGTALGLTNVSFSMGVGLPPVIFGVLKESTGVYTHVPRLSGAALIIAGLCIQLHHLAKRCPAPK